MYVEIYTRNPLSRLTQIEVSQLKNIPCILVMNQAGRMEEQEYYEDIVGIKGNYLFADSLQEARLKIVTGQGYMPVDIIGKQAWYDSSVSRIPLVRNGKIITKTYCAFWRKDNSGYYIESFGELLKKCF